MQKVVLVAFNGEAMCFVHVLLNALDLHKKGVETKVIIEGSATKLIAVLADEQQPFANLYRQVKEQGLIECVCKACAAKMGTLKAAEAQNLPICDDMAGHPGLHRYLAAGYQVITF